MRITTANADAAGSRRRGPRGESRLWVVWSWVVTLDADFPDGYAVEALEPAPAGLSHHVLFGLEAESRVPVVLKLEQIPGRLAIEHRALRWLHQSDVAVPRVHWFGTARVGGIPSVRCLVTERVGGTPAQSAASWSRMGQALQRLEGVPWGGSGLPVLDGSQFLLSHDERAAALAVGHSAFSGGEPTPSFGPLVMTHGDPGDGNYLESETKGVLLDWEQAQVAPRGLDLARAVFVALVRAAESGSGDPRNAQAAMAGYLADSTWKPTTSEMRWWLEVAGLQVVHSRWLRSGQPGMPAWRDAATVLEAALADDSWLIRAGTGSVHDHQLRLR